MYDNIDVDIKSIQAVQIELLKEFVRICNKNKIKYQLFSGTLLGAIRHKGFIPWDDDIDVCLLREDYNKFLKICNDELDSKYFIQNYDTDKNSMLQFTKIRKNNTIFKMDLYKDVDMHHGIFIDVFPLDNTNPKFKMAKLQRMLINIMFTISSFRSKDNCRNAKTVARKYIKFAFYYILKLFPGSSYDKLITKVMCVFNSNKTGYITHFTNGASKKRYNKYTMSLNEFNDTIEWEFEGDLYSISKEYHNVLSRIFGDYKKLPPQNEQRPHHGVIEIKL